MARLLINMDSWSMQRWTLGVMAGCAGLIYIISGIRGIMPNYTNTTLLSVGFLYLSYGSTTHALPFSRRGLYLSRIAIIGVANAGSVLLWLAGAGFAVLFLGKTFPMESLKLEFWCAFFFGLAWIGPGLYFLWLATPRGVGAAQIVIKLIPLFTLMFLPWDRLSMGFAQLAHPLEIAGAAVMLIVCGFFIAAGLRRASRRDF